jgi:S-methylmethionine-dependent homocysteine/selenocysteine methylase
MQLPFLLSGPYGSLVNEREHTSLDELFRRDNIDPIRTALRDYKLADVNQPVTPTFGASARGPRPGVFTSEMRRWNTNAGFLTKQEFPNSTPLGSVAPLLDTCGHDDKEWATVRHQVEVARRAHTHQLEAQRDAQICAVLLEAAHDFYEAIGFVLAAGDTGMQRAIVSFQPTKKGLPRNAETCLSYPDIADRLRSHSQGTLRVDIGLNCDNYDGIEQALRDNPAGTFAAVYPNQCAVPLGDHGEEFWGLANKNHLRTAAEESKFQMLRQRYALPRDRILRILLLCREKSVESMGLCCGANPEHIRALGEMMKATHPASQPQPLLA